MQKLPFFKKLFDFFIFSNLFIALCTVIMLFYTGHLFKITLNPALFWFLFFATLASYNLHWYLTDASKEITVARSKWLTVNKKTHWMLFIFASIAGMIFGMRIISYWLLFLPLVFFTLLYTAPKFPHSIFKQLEKHIIGKTFLLTLVWTYATTILPMLITSAEWTWLNTVFSIHRFTLIFPICILFDIRDKRADRITGIKSIVTLLPAKTIRRIFNVFILLHLLTSPLAFFVKMDNFLIYITFLIPSIITYRLYPKAIKSTNAYLFYFVLDGLMILAPVCYFLIILFQNI